MAKFGIALEWGSRGLEFESRHSDHKTERVKALSVLFLSRNHPSTYVSWLPFWGKAKTVLQEQVQCQGQQGISGILLACHQEQQEHHQQVLNIKILWQQLA